MQRALWSSQRLSPDQPVQNTALLSRIHAPINPDRLAAAFARVVADHDVLRTRIVRRSDGDQVQLIDLADTAELSEIISATPEEIDAIAAARCRVPIDMATRGFDSVIARHEDGTCSWYLNLHHVITDATSSALVFAATADAYCSDDHSADDHSADDDSAGVPVPGQQSYYAWVDEKFGSEREPDRTTARALSHWADRSTAPPIDRLYRLADRPLDGEPTTAASRLSLDFDQDLRATLSSRLETDYKLFSPDLSWTVLLTSTMATYLHRLTGASEFSIGIPVHNRSRPETRSLVGPTMEVFPVDVNVEPDDTYRTLHKRLANAVVDTLRHAAPGTSPQPDFAAIVNVIPRADQRSFGPHRATTRWIHPGAVDSSNLLRLQMTTYADDVDGDHEFILDLNHRGAEPQHREYAADHVVSILKAMVTDPDSPVGAGCLATEDEQAVINGWETTEVLATPTIDHAGDLVPHLLDQLEQTTSVVLSQAGKSLNGPELRRWIEATARWIDDHDVPAGGRVAINVERSMEAVVAVMATLASGRSFVPLDVSQPEARRERLIARAGCALVLSSCHEIAQLAEAAHSGNAFDVPSRRPGDEAYLLFTSGSTGEPKGVAITSQGLVDYLNFAVDAYVEADQRVVAPMFSALTFDLTITTLFVPLLVGGHLVVIPDDGPTGLAAIAANPEITWAKATPSHLEILHRLLPHDHRLRTLIVGGEAFGSALAASLLRFNPEARIFNEYGPTEAVVGCMIYQVEPELLARQQEVPIGRPSPGVTLRVVDQYLQAVPPGVSGELLIHHRGVTNGYLTAADGPTTDAEASTGPFVELDGLRFYRSGDLVRLQDGQRLVYLGRIDEQVKIGGRRLEPIEVEQALAEHPAISRAAVRVWSPSAVDPGRHCLRCGLPDNVPGVDFDEAGICATCYSYDAVAPVTQSWFKSPDDLRTELEKARSNRTGSHDVLHLLSGGKDSTYALYQLVELGAVPYAITLDNGFISEGAKENVRRSVADLGIDHEFVTTEAMNEIFADSLATHSNVCNGCYKTIYTLATNRASQLGIPLIVTGLSRGQLFETRLIPQQFDLDRFDPDAIDRAVLEARKIYHRTDDAANRLLDTGLFATDDIFSQISYLDFYRYVDVELSEMLEFLTSRAPWVRPADTGRSTNCLINAAGIHTHLTEQGYHNYAIPYAWDVRLGHKTRDEAIEELDDQLDLDEVSSMLTEVGYQPHRQEILTAWFELYEHAGERPDPAELRSFLAQRLPDYAIPAAFVVVDGLPLTVNGKLDAVALPEPQRVHRPSAGLHVAATSETERRVVDIWEQVLGIEPIGIDDDFFTIGGDSLAALESIVALADVLKIDASEDLAFRHTTPRLLAAALDELHVGGGVVTAPPVSAVPPPHTVDGNRAPELSTGQQAILFDQANRPTDVMYNIGRVYRVDVDSPMLSNLGAMKEALVQVAERHQTLHWTYGANRQRLLGSEAVVFTVNEPVVESELQAALVAEQRQPFDLERGPLLRCLVQPVVDTSGTRSPTSVQLTVHHAAADADSFDLIWREMTAIAAGETLPALSSDYATLSRWQQEREQTRARDYWMQADVGRGTRLDFMAPGSLGTGDDTDDGPAPDGYLSRPASVSPDELTGTDGASGFAVALTAIGQALRRCMDQADVEVGLITSTRTHEVADELVGYFLNTIPFVVDHDPVAVSRQLGSALSARSYPLARILADRRQADLPAAPPTVYVSYTDFSIDDPGSPVVDQRVLDTGSSVADATVFVQRDRDRITLGLEYRGSVLTGSQAEWLLASIDRSLRGLTGQEQTRIEVENKSRLAGPHPTTRANQPDTVFGQITQLLEAGGVSPAVVCGSETVSWADLEVRSRAVALDLLAQGMQPGEPVVVSFDRSVDLIAGIVGVLRAGGAYVAIDPGYPVERQRLLTERSGARFQARAWAELATPSADSAGSLPTIEPEQLAYIIFTSGSTGEPKPVAITHDRLTTSTRARIDFYDDNDGWGGPDLSADDGFRFLMVSSASFDSSVAGIFWALLEGGTLVLPTDEQVHDVDAVADLCVRERITHTLMVPTLYQAVMNSMVRRGLVRPAGEGRWWPPQIVVAGEACPPALVEQHYRLFPLTRLTNEYGPTEATVWATAQHIKYGDDPVPIGSPIAGAWVEVIGPDGQVRPQGIAGELVIGGSGVAEQFGSSYRTGDRAVVVDDWVYYLGRLDNQLNVGGLRVEPEEIERLLAAAPEVNAAVVVANDRSQLVAHVEVGDAGVLEGFRRTGLVDDLRDVAAAKLPPLWRPAGYGIHAELPLTPNGKLDRAAAADLPVDQSGDGPAVRADAVDDADSRLMEMAGLFAEALGRPGFRPDDSFFEFGGHSLVAIELLLTIEEQFGVRVPVPVLYRGQTPRALVHHIDQHAGQVDVDAGRSGGGDAGELAFLVPIQPKGTKPPIFAIHVLGIDSIYFRPLAARLGDDQPLYGLGQPTRDTELRTDGPTSVHDVAAAYVAEINRAHPDGPIIVTAISLGGTVAFETAQQLRAAGRDVALLALFDAAGPEAKLAMDDLGFSGRVGTHLRALREDPVDYVVGRTAYNMKKLIRAAELAETKARWRLGLAASHRLDVRRFIEENIQSQMNYTFKPYDGPMAVYKAADDPFTGHFLDIQLGWTPVADGGIKIDVVEGDHLTMVAEPNVERLAELLEADIAEHLGRRR